MNVPNFASEVASCTSITYVDVVDLAPVVVCSVALGLLLFDMAAFVGGRVVAFIAARVRAGQHP
ncbi:hypothetical protein [Nevskia ramosa]|uniref:hypothetical protein n=1 Tax=Nevskia ramosa TaxID=64002 RepID=UPI003D0C3132